MSDLSELEAEADALLALGPLTLDVCEVCKKPLHENERVEVAVTPPSFEDEYGGFTAVLVAYCQEHAP